MISDWLSKLSVFKQHLPPISVFKQHLPPICLPNFPDCDLKVFWLSYGFYLLIVFGISIAIWLRRPFFRSFVIPCSQPPSRPSTLQPSTSGPLTLRSSPSQYPTLPHSSAPVNFIVDQNLVDQRSEQILRPRPIRPSSLLSRDCAN